jgi:RNA polymerase sigma-70 factor (ECF subfamily)
MEAEDSALPYEPASAGPSALDTVAQHEVAERVTAAMSGLPIEHRETVVLRFQEGLRLEEIATLTKLPLGTVKSRLYRALNMLMNRLQGARL